MPKDAFRPIEQRTQAYWFYDGIWEVGFGLLLLVFSGFQYLLSSVPQDSSLAGALAVGQLVAMVLAYYLLHRVVRWFKERITYPRTGYVAYHKPIGAARVVRIVRLALMSAAIGALMATLAALPSLEQRVPAVSGALLGLGSFYLAWKFNVLRFWLQGIATLMLGFGLSFVPLTGQRGTAAFFLGYGALWLLSGAVTMAVYLRGTAHSSLGTQDQEDDRGDPL